MRACIAQDFRDLCYMMLGNLRRVKTKELREIGSIPALRKLMEDPDDVAMARLSVKVERVICLPTCLPVCPTVPVFALSASGAGFGSTVW